MGLFRRKDPLAEKERQLREQIAALEAQIRQLASQQAQAPAASGPPPFPRLRSTTFPHGPTVPGSLPAVPSAQVPPPVPVFEEVNPFQAPAEGPAAEPAAELGVGQQGVGSAWQRFKRHFRGPATSNPKLVNYLAAGSIQGLRPLRYEKRVARNRFILLVVLLIVVLLGFFSVFLRH